MSTSVSPLFTKYRSKHSNQKQPRANVNNNANPILYRTVMAYHFQWDESRRLRINHFPRTGERIPFFSTTHPSIKALFHWNQFGKLSVSCWCVAKAGPLSISLSSAPQPPPSYLMFVNATKRKYSYTTAVLADIKTFQTYRCNVEQLQVFLNCFVQLNNKGQKEHSN